MNNKLNNIFSETNCLSPGILLAYAENKLNANDRHLVEKHLTDCELCSEALEGLSLIKNKSNLSKVFAGINRDIDNKTETKKTKIFHFDFKMRLAAAAILITVLGISILFRFFLGEQKKDLIAQRLVRDSVSPKQEKESGEKNNEALLEKTKTVQDKSKGKNDNTVLIKDAESGKLNKGSEVNTFRASGSYAKDQGQADIQQQQAFSGFYKTSGLEEEKKAKEKDADKTDENKNITLPAVAENKIVQKEQVMSDSIGVSGGNAGTKTTTLNQLAENKNEMSKEESQPKQGLKNKISLKNDKKAPATTVSTTVNDNSGITYDQRYSDGVQKYSDADYSGSKDLLESYISENPGDYSALYYCGASYYFLGQFNNAIKYFEKVMKNKDGSFYETAQWYLALSYIAQKENKKAEKILNEIVKSKGSFKTQAEEKLLEIK